MDRGLSGPEIEEVIQDVRVRVWQAQRRHDERQLSSSYLYRAATSAALDLVRRRRRQHTVSIEDLEGELPAPRHTPQPERDLAMLHLEEEVRKAVEALPGPAQAALRMHLLGYPRRDIARLLKWSDGRTRNILHRGLKRLRTTLLERGITPYRSK